MTNWTTDPTPVLRTFKIYQNKESSICRRSTYIK